MRHITKICVDMDGVIYDLTGACAKLDGYEYQGRWFEYLIHNNITLDRQIGGNMKRYVEEGLFKVGNLTTCAHNLFEELLKLKHTYGVRLEILGALPRSSHNMEIAKVHKLEFIENNIPKQIFDEVKLVEGSSSKIYFCDKNTLLIDDYQKTQKQFIDADLNFLLFRNVNSMKTEFLNYTFGKPE